MKTNVSVALILGIIGIVLLTGGVAASVNTVSTMVRCEACGTTMSKTDISTIQVLTPDGVTHWACSPTCAAELAIYYQNDTIKAKCFVSGSAIQISVVNGNFTSVSVSPSSPQDNVQVVEGENGINIASVNSMNAEKFVSTTAFANQLLLQNYSSNPNAITRTLQQTFFMGQTMLPMMPPTYRAVQIPNLYYAFMIVGGALFAAAPISWKFLKNRNKL